MKQLTFMTAGLLILIVGLAIGVFAFDGYRRSDRIARNVSAVGIDLSGMSVDQVRVALAEYEDDLRQPVEVEVDSELAVLDPASLGVEIDVNEAVLRAHAVGRTGSMIQQYREWMKSWFTDAVVDVAVEYDPAAVRRALVDLERTVVDRPPFDGAVELVGETVVARFPVAGATLELDTAAALLAGALQSPRRVAFRLPLVTVPTLLSADDVTAAARYGQELIDTPIVIRDPRGIGEATIVTTELRAALRSDIVAHSPPTLDVWLDAATIRTSVAAHVPLFETNPTSAWFEFDDETVEFRVRPSTDGTTIDVDAATAMVVAATVSDTVVQAPITTGELPEYSTEALEAMSMTKVSEFTTYHSCCEARVTNIQLMADTIDGAVVWPGETFSINEHVGRRTIGKGYRRAGAIIGGEVSCCDSAINIGGGTSQFGTTFYNAVFYGCYEDVEHQPHSIYFSRYPRGREATLGYPKPDVIFRNDTSTPVWIDTSHTGNSITVTFYGDTEGRVCVDEVEGGNPITVTRVITYPDGTVVREPFRWSYRAFA